MRMVLIVKAGVGGGEAHWPRGREAAAASPRRCGSPAASAPRWCSSF